MSRTVLFVTYGGGHARMVIPVIRELIGYPDIRIESIALTTGGPIFKSEGLPYMGYKDFITQQDKEALAWGRKLAAQYHVAETGIEEEESIAYLGLSYWDLVLRHGEAEAGRLWQEKGRHAFLQLTVFERVLDRLKPDLVVTTNSPRSEQAAVQIANKAGIPTLAIVDLFGIYHFQIITADYIAVLCEQTIDNMRKEGVTRPREAFFITGNPAFDRAFDYRGPVDTNWRRNNIPSLPENANTLLWTDIPAYWNFETRQMHIRSDEEVLRELDMMAHAAKVNNVHLLIRPHPSQQRGIYDAWMKKHNYPYVHYAGGFSLYPLLKAVDVVVSYGSTVMVEALLMQRRIIQLKYYAGTFTDMPLGEWGIAWLAENNDHMSQRVHEAFNDNAKAESMQALATEILPQGKAATNVTNLVKNILSV